MTETVELQEDAIKALIAQLEDDVTNLPPLEASRAVDKIIALKSKLNQMAYKVPRLGSADAAELKDLTERASNAQSMAADRQKWLMKIVDLVL